MQTTEIPLSKTKMLFLALAAIAFVALGIWFVSVPATFSRNSFLRSETVIIMVGVASIVFFGLCGVVIITRLVKNKPGLVLTAEGFTDQVSWTNKEMVPWRDIVDLNIVEINSQQMISVFVNDPEDYISKQTGSFKRRLLRLNYKMYKTPVFIATTGLKIKTGELLDLMNEYRNALVK